MKSQLCKYFVSVEAGASHTGHMDSENCPSPVEKV